MTDPPPVRRFLPVCRFLADDGALLVDFKFGILL
jgi:hypothetical protein